MLIERQDPQAVGVCRETVASSQRDLARLYALSVLSAMPKGLDKSTWMRAIEDPAVHVRLWAWVYANRLGEITSEFVQEDSDRIQAAMLRESDLEVQMAMAVRSLLLVPKEQDRVAVFAIWLKRKDPGVLAFSGDSRRRILCSMRFSFKCSNRVIWSRYWTDGNLRI